ncbi:LysR family transcriptional regulator [Methylovirgula sp. 4M-Z18]|uniref:LysR family transcriptional regulator n=1 Tax=Methylovirgula sp. 4M-Z18 TaxID=2293567 RepID=UPI0013146192|nr:LysR family transcriptional regulator [Methylovirgula sp. 4M-Z18]
MRHIPWDGFQLFLTIAEARSLREAAVKLKISAATVSRRLEALEQQIGAPLFERLPGTLRLLPLGEALLPEAAAMRERADALNRLIGVRDAFDQGPVVVTTTASVALFLARHLLELHAACAPVGIELSASRQILNLARREADIALRLRRPPAEGDLRVKRVSQMTSALYAAKSYLAQERWRGGEDDVRRLAFFAVGQEPERSQRAAWLRAVMGTKRPLAQIDELHLRLEAVRQGGAAALLPCWIGESDPDLTCVGGRDAPFREDIYLIFHNDLAQNPRVRRAAAAISDLLKRRAADLAGPAGANLGRS